MLMWKGTAGSGDHRVLDLLMVSLRSLSAVSAIPLSSSALAAHIVTALLARDTTCCRRESEQRKMTVPCARKCSTCCCSHCTQSSPRVPYVGRACAQCHEYTKCCTLLRRPSRHRPVLRHDNGIRLLAGQLSLRVRVAIVNRLLVLIILTGQQSRDQRKV